MRTLALNEEDQALFFVPREDINIAQIWARRRSEYRHFGPHTPVWDSTFQCVSYLLLEFVSLPLSNTSQVALHFAGLEKLLWKMAL